MWIYGRKPVLEAIDAGDAVRVLLAAGISAGAAKDVRSAARKAGLSVDEVPRIELDRALGTTHHQGVAAELPAPEASDVDDAFALAERRGERLLLVLLDGVQDPRNLGAIIRSAEALGAHGVVREGRRSAPLSAVAVKASAGATAHLPLVEASNLPRFMAQLKDRDVWLYGAAPDAPAGPADHDWDRQVGLVIGGEGAGLRRLVRERCDELVRIPLRGRVESLNASVAAGVLLYAIAAGRDRPRR